MSSNGLVCWNCGASLAELSLPLRRLDACKACNVELHACRLCEFYDTAVAKHCREPVADEVKDKGRANFCDYFKPKPGAYIAPDSAASKARAELEAMFGGTVIESTDLKEAARSALGDFFKKK
jgi:hypothetical protein